MEAQATMSITEERYKYIVIGKTSMVHLQVDEKDVLINADGEIDCPLDTVLRKNTYTFADFNNWEAESVHFIKIDSGEEAVVRTMNLNKNL